jgi:hypothetical protein
MLDDNQQGYPVDITMDRAIGEGATPTTVCRMLLQCSYEKNALDVYIDIFSLSL